MADLFISRSGVLSARLNGVALHSAYDPFKEAQRFLTENLPQTPVCLILIASGLGYLDRAALKLYPQTRILSLHAESGLPQAGGLFELKNPNYSLWTAEQGASLPQFLSSRLSEEVLQGLKILVWPAAADQQPANKDIVHILSGFIERLQGSFYTTAHFGRRWLLNITRNFLGWSRQAHIGLAPAAVIAASGYSLNQALPLLAKRRNSFLLIALPSSLLALKEAGLQPDLTVSIDGGYWAKRYLQILNSQAGVAMPLLGAPAAGKPLWLFSFNTPFENSLLQGYHAPILPWQGTVAATAIALALQLSGGPVALVGQDLAVEGLKQHVFPHPFDMERCSAANRFVPGVQMYQKELWQSSRNLPLYAAWFAQQRWPQRLVRLYPSPTALPIKELAAQDFLAWKPFKKQSLRARAAPFALNQRKERLRLAFKAWEQSLADCGAEFNRIAFYLAPCQYARYQEAAALQRPLNGLKEALQEKAVESLHRAWAALGI